MLKFIKDHIDHLVQSTFVRQVMVMVGGTAVAQVVTIGFSPIVTRIFTPEDFGVMAVFVSVVGAIGSIATLSYPIAIVLPKRSAEALGLVRLSLYIGFLFSLLVFVINLFFSKNIFGVLDIDGIQPYVNLIPVALLFSVVGSVVLQWLTRERLFSLIAKVVALQAVIINILKVCVGYLYPMPIVLIISYLLGLILSPFFMFLGIYNKKHGTNRRYIKKRNVNIELYELAKQYSDFPLYRTPQNLLNTVSASVPLLLSAHFFGAASSGYYSLAIAILSVPITLISGSVLQVIYPKINEAYHEGRNVRSILIKATLWLFVTGLVPLMIVVLLGPDIFEFVFGEGWYRAGEYAQWLSVGMFMHYINRPVIAAIPILQLQKGLLVWEICDFSLKVIVLYLGYSMFNNDLVMIAFFSLSSGLAYLFLVFWVIQVSGQLCNVEESVYDK